MAPRRGRWILPVSAAALAAALAARACSLRPAQVERAAGAREEARSGEAPLPAAAPAPPLAASPSAVLLAEPSAGWESEAETIAAGLRRILDGRPRAGAYAEARAEAARADLALFPPPRDRVRRLLLGSERDRTLALAALAARPDLDDDLLRLVLRSQRPEDDELLRLLGAEIAAAAPAELGARHEDDLLRAFEVEPNPLVLAVALPALERMDEARLRRLLRAQLAVASPEMLPVLLALARGRLGAAGVEDVRAALAAGPERP
ncbi:MAG TPA: hypothetical protein VFL83_02590 [Anaeromyxobacter sp.]|nr:hypothetical protein [Anaeromyxobacter sp.]